MYGCVTVIFMFCAGIVVERQFKVVDKIERLYDNCWNWSQAE
jgi:hypothetical protein